MFAGVEGVLVQWGRPAPDNWCSIRPRYTDIGTNSIGWGGHWGITRQYRSMPQTSVCGFSQSTATPPPAGSCSKSPGATGAFFRLKRGSFERPAPVGRPRCRGAPTAQAGACRPASRAGR
jgi:hypothetical protein